MKISTQQLPTYTLILVVGLALGAVTTLGATVFADGDPTTDDVPRMLPYQGTLEINGQPVHATGTSALAMRFDLYDSAEAPEPVYSQRVTVEVYAGRFTTTIGPEGEGPAGEVVAIGDVVAAADDLHLGIVLLNDLEDPEDDTALANRQRLMATPYAMWTTTATSFTVARDLSAGGALRVGGTAHVGTGRPLSGAAQLQLDTNLAEGAPDNFNDYQVLMNRGASPAASHGIGVQSDGALFLNTTDDVVFYEDGQQRLHMDGGTLRTQNVAATGTISGDFQLALSGEHSVSHHNQDGSTERNMGATSDRFCFLTKAGYRDVDGGSEYAECRVFATGGQWKLRAHLNNTGDADAYCTARCISW